MESNPKELYEIMESFKKLIQDWIIWKKLVLNPSIQDNPKIELEEKLEELLTKVFEVQTSITEWTEKIEMELNAPHLFDLSRFCRPSSQLQEKLEETSRKLQAAQISLNITSLGLKENLELVLDPSSQNDSIAELKEKLQETIPEIQNGMFLAAIRLRKILVTEKF